jgi:hypothetical protein
MEQRRIDPVKEAKVMTVQFEQKFYCNDLPGLAVSGEKLTYPNYGKCEYCDHILRLDLRLRCKECGAAA